MKFLDLNNWIEFEHSHSNRKGNFPISCGGEVIFLPTNVFSSVLIISFNCLSDFLMKIEWNTGRHKDVLPVKMVNDS